MIEINLVPDVKQEFLRAQRAKNSVISIAIIVGISAVGIIVLLSGIVGGQVLKSALDDATIKSESGKLQQVEDLNNTVTLQNQLGKLAEMHDTKKMNSRIFDVLTVVNPPEPNNVQVSDLKLDPEFRTLTIEGAALNGYAAVEVLKKTILNTTIQYSENGEAIKEPLTSVVNVSETSYGEDAQGRKVLRFALSFEYPDQLLSRTIENARIVSPSSDINVTDSFIRVPESLFSQRPADLTEGEE